MNINFEFLHSLGDKGKLAIYEIQANDHVRFIAPYDGKFYIFFCDMADTRKPPIMLL